MSVQNARTRVRQAKRWLATYDKRWRAIRERVLTEEPYCRVCGDTATEVDHINGRADRRSDYQRNNLQALCQADHAEKTAQEAHGGRWRPKGMRLDGMPRDPNHHWHREVGAGG